MGEEEGFQRQDWEDVHLRGEERMKLTFQCRLRLYRRKERREGRKGGGVSSEVVEMERRRQDSQRDPVLYLKLIPFCQTVESLPLERVHREKRIFKHALPGGSERREGKGASSSASFVRGSLEALVEGAGSNPPG